MNNSDPTPIGAAAVAAAKSASPVGVPEPEVDVWRGRTSWLHYIGRIAVWSAGNLAAAVLMGMAVSRLEWMTWSRAALAVVGLVVVSGVIVLGPAVLRVLGTSYRLTSQRLFIERGILSRTTDQTELIRVDDVRLHQTLLNRIFNIGTVSLMTTDATDRVVTIEGVKSPREVSESVRQKVHLLRRKSVYVETI